MKIIQTMNKWIKILLGLILLVVPLYLIFPASPLHTWGIAALELIKGFVTIFILLIGIILITLGIIDLKNN